MVNLTEKEAQKLGIQRGRSKYNARATVVDGIRFDSKAEADYYIGLKQSVRSGLISGFCRQARFICIEGKDGEKGTEYLADFIIFYPDGSYRIVDVKGVETDVFKLKMKCLKEKYPEIKIEMES